MLVKLYRDKTPIAVLSLPLLIAILCLPIFFYPEKQSYYFLQWQTDLESLIIVTDWLNFLITVVLVGLTAHQLNNVYNRHTFYSKASFLPGLIYTLLLFSFDELRFSPNLIAHLFLVFSLGQLLKLRRQEGAKAHIFWATLLIGVAIAFSSFQTLTLILPLISLAVFRPFVWREWFMVLLGGSIPLMYYLATLFIIRGNLNLKIAERVEQPEIELDLFQVFAVVMTILILFGSLVKYISIMRTEVIRFKKQSQILIHFIWISIAIWAVGHYFFEHLYLSFTVPLSFIVATALLESKRKNTANLIVIIWLIISIANVLLTG